MTTVASPCDDDDENEVRCPNHCIVRFRIDGSNAIMFCNGLKNKLCKKPNEINMLDPWSDLANVPEVIYERRINSHCGNRHK